MSYTLPVNYATRTPNWILDRAQKTYKAYLPIQKLKQSSTWFQRVTIIITKPTITIISHFKWAKNQQHIFNVQTHWVTHSCYIGLPK